MEGLFERRETVAPPEPVLKFNKISPEAEAPPIIAPGFTNNPPSRGEPAQDRGGREECDTNNVEALASDHSSEPP